MAKQVFLDFEKDLGEIAGKIEALENEDLEKGTADRHEIKRLEGELVRRTAEIYHDLTPGQTTLVARHPNRPYTMDYIDAIFEDFHELHGDRAYADDQSIVGGLARLAEHAVMVIGHQKGRDTRERTRRNFGMTKPEGYRKALRLMKLAEKFNLPVFTFVDTPGAYPGIGAEERNQSEAIGRNIYELTKLRVPVISTIIGEGGSGGALAIAVADVVLMLQYSTYSVISPEGCASILWKDAKKSNEAASALGLTADRLYDLKLVDKVISEPLGGAHRDPKLMASTLKKVLVDQLKIVKSMTVEELMGRRLERLLSFGRFESTDPSAVARFADLYSTRMLEEDDEEVVAQEQAFEDVVATAEEKTEVKSAKKAAPKKRTTTKAKTTTTAKTAKSTKTTARKTAKAKIAETAQTPAAVEAPAEAPKTEVPASEAAPAAAETPVETPKETTEVTPTKKPARRKAAAKPAAAQGDAAKAKPVRKRTVKKTADAE